MPIFQRLALWACVLLLASLLCGIHRHGLHRLCRWLTPYLAAVMAGDLMQLLWTDRFYRWKFFVAKETLYGALKLGLAIELAAVMFAAFPGAAATARRASLLALLGLCAALVVARPTGLLFQDLAMEIHPRLANGTAFLLLVVWLLALWYHVPTHRFHRAILGGLTSYLLVFTVLLRFLQSRGWDLRYLASYGDALGYLTMLAYWTGAAWRKEPSPSTNPDLLKRLQPWRGTL